MIQTDYDLTNQDLQKSYSQPKGTLFIIQVVFLI